MKVCAMDLLFLLLLLPLFTLAAGQQILFVNPTIPGDNGDYSLDPTFVLGSNVNIQWTGTGSQSISLVMYQQAPNAIFEYVFRMFSQQIQWIQCSPAMLISTCLCRRHVHHFLLYVDGQHSERSLDLQRLLFPDFCPGEWGSRVKQSLLQHIEWRCKRSLGYE